TVDPAAAEHQVVLIERDDLSRSDGRLWSLEEHAHAVVAEGLDGRGNGVVPRTDLSQAVGSTVRHWTLPVESGSLEPCLVERLAAPHRNGIGLRLNLHDVPRGANSNPQPAPLTDREAFDPA